MNQTTPMTISTFLLCLGLAGTVGCWTSQNAENGDDSQTEPESVASDPAQTAQPNQGSADQKSESAEGSPIDPGDVPPVDSTVELSEKQWRERLTEKQFHVLREAGTERAGSGELLANKKTGVYYCAACGNPLYSSRHKFDSNTGWPSFWDTIEDGRVAEKPDRSMGMERTETVCGRCGGHLGHVFDDGPPPTGLRHCINSAALEFRPANDEGVVENPPEYDISD